MGKYAGKTLLIVEDEAIIALMEKQQLEKLGYRVHCVHSGEQALSWLQQAETHTDLILMDIDLGRGMDGTETARRILETCDIPIIFNSSHTEPEIVERTENISSYGYVVKNSGITVLDASLRMAFKLHEAYCKEKARDQALIRSLQTAEQLVGGIPSGLFVYRVDTAERMYLELANAEAEKLTGITLADYRDREFDELWPQAAALGIREQYLSAHRSGKLLEMNDVQYTDGRISGTYRIRVFPLPEARLAVAFEDTTALNLSIERQIASEIEKAIILDNAHDMVLTLDAMGTILSINRPPAELRDIDIIGASVYSFAPEDQVTTLRALLTEVLTTGAATRFEMDARDFGTGSQRYHVHAARIGQSQSQYRLIVVVNDISSEVRLRQRLEHNEAMHRAIIREAMDGFLLIGLDGRFLQTNDAMCRMTGYSETELLGLSISQLDAIESPAQTEMHTRLVIERGADRFESRHRRKDGSMYPVEISAHYLPAEGGRLFAFFRDLSDSQLAEQERLNELKRLKAQYDIARYEARDLQGFVDHALDQAIRITGSKFGYLYFYNEDEKIFTLNAWSGQVMRECSVMNPQTKYQLEKTGLWGEAVRQRRPILVNDFSAPNPLKKGYPEGHVPLRRFLTIPVFLDGRIVAVAGLANKEEAYTQTDQYHLSILMDTTWQWIVRMESAQSLQTLSGAYERERALVQKATRNVLESQDGRSCVEDLLCVARDLSGANDGFLALFEDSARISDVVLAGSDGGVRWTPAPAQTGVEADSLLAWAVSADQNCFENDRRWLVSGGLFAEHHLLVHSLLAAPVIYNRQKLGVLCLINKPGGFSEHDATVADEMARLAALGLQRFRHEAELGRQLGWKENMLRELQHRVKNNLSIVYSLLSISGSSIQDAAALQVLEENSGRIQTVAKLYELLYRSGSSDTVMLDEYLQSLQTFFMAMQGRTGSVSIQTKSCALAVPGSMAVTLGLLVHELVMNALKHAFVGRASGRIDISTEVDTENNLLLCVQDDGVGFPADDTSDTGRGVGFSIIEGLLQQIEASMSRENSPRGAAVRVSVPL